MFPTQTPAIAIVAWVQLHHILLKAYAVAMPRIPVKGKLRQEDEISSPQFVRVTVLALVVTA